MKLLNSPFREGRNPKGFTLIELLVVIAIIAILAGLGLAAMGGVMDNARKTEVRSMAHQIKSAISTYYTEYGTFPTNKTTDQAFYRMMTATDPDLNRSQNRRGIRFLEVPGKFIAPGENGIVTPPRFYPTGQSNFTIITDAMRPTNAVADDKPYDGKITLPNRKVVSGSVAVYVPDPKKKGEDAWIGTW